MKLADCNFHPESLISKEHYKWLIIYQEIHQRHQKEGGRKCGNFFLLVLGEPLVTARKNRIFITCSSNCVIIRVRVVLKRTVVGD